MNAHEDKHRVGDSPEWLVLLECARPAPRQPVPELLGRCNHHLLLALAEEHGATNLLACFLRSWRAELPADFAQSVQERQRLNAIAALSLIAEMLRATELLTAAGIEVLVMKGPALSLQAYGDPALRQYGDIDLLVRGRDIYRVTQLLEQNGYSPRVPLSAVASGKIPGEYVFTREARLLIEVHTERTLRYFPNPLLVEELFARRQRLELNGKSFATLSLEDALLAMCTHGTKHFWERLQWVADLTAMLHRNAQQIDWNKTLASARALAMERIFRTGLLLAKEVLGAEMPAEIEAWIQRDRIAGKMAAQLARSLPDAGESQPRLLSRAVFRMRMRGNVFAGFAYLLRLSLSPTEHDWDTHAHRSGGRLRESSRRLLRLAAKYKRNGAEE